MSEKIRGLGQMEVGGKIRPFRVNGIRQTSIFCEELGIELDEYMGRIQKLGKIVEVKDKEPEFKLTDLIGYTAFVYSALVAGAKHERMAVDFDCEKVLEWFENAEGNEGVEFAKPFVLFLEIIEKAKQELEAQKPKKL